jgi:dipeptidyl aminopeptidase/acylaminoacyl peptidase
MSLPIVLSALRLAGALAVLLAASPAATAAGTALPLELAYDHAQLWEGDAPVTVAPGGDAVAFVVRRVPAEVDVARRNRWAASGMPIAAAGSQVYVSDTRSGRMRQICDNGGYGWRPAWSPDGKRLALYSDAGGEVGLWIHDRVSDRCSRVGDVVIKANLFPGDEAQWSPDGSRVYVPRLPEGRASGFEAAGENERIAPTQSRDLVLYVSAGTSAGTALTAGEDAAQGDQALLALRDHLLRENNAALTAVGLADAQAEVLVPAAAEPRPSVVRVSPSGRWLSLLSVAQPVSATSDAMTFTLAVVGRDGGAVHVVAEDLAVAQSDYYRRNYAWHPSHDRLIYLRDGGLYCVQIGADGPQPPRRLGAELGLLTAGLHWFTRDGRAVVVGVAPERRRLSSLEDPPPTGLAVVPLDGGSALRVAIDPQRWAFQNLVKADARTVWQPDGRTLTVQLRDLASGESVALRIDPQTDARRELWRGRARIRGLAAAADGQDLYGTYEDAATPQDVYRFSTRLQRSTRLSRIAPELEAVAGVRVETFTTRVPTYDHDFLEVRTAVLLPADTAPGRAPPPGIVTFYPDSDASTEIERFGGGDRAGVPALVLVSRGYAVVYPHVKTGPGGEPGQVVDEMLDALMPQLHRAADLGHVERTRLALQGNSFGGYATAAIVTRTQLFRAAVPTNGIYDLIGFTYGGAPAGNVAWAESRQPRLGTHLWDAPLRYVENSPLFALDRIRTPLLILQGGDDVLRPEAEKLFTALKRLGKPAELAIYERSGHYISAWPRRQAIAATERLLAFYERHLRGSD